MKVRICFTLLLVVLFACNNTGREEDSITSSENEQKAYPGNITALFRSVEQHPDNTGLRLQLSAGLDSIGHYKEALRQMDSLLVRDSTNYGLWFANARIAENAGDTVLAMQSYDRALHIYPSAEAMLSLANLYAEVKNERALLICESVKRLKLGREYDAHCAFIAGVYNARTGNTANALRFFDESIANDYTYMEAYIEKGLVYFDNGQYRDALHVFSFASSVNTLNPDPYYWQGRCFEMLNIKDSAELRYKQSLSLDKNDAAVKEALKRSEQ